MRRRVKAVKVGQNGPQRAGLRDAKPLRERQPHAFPRHVRTARANVERVRIRLLEVGRICAEYLPAIQRAAQHHLIARPRVIRAASVA